MKSNIEQIKPIHSDSEHEAALRMIEPYFENEPVKGSVAGDRFELLCLVIEDYEKKRYPMPPPDPVEAIKFRMEQAGLTPKDLTPMIGRLNRVYEILNGSRKLTLPMIRKLHSQLHIPVECLIGL